MASLGVSLNGRGSGQSDIVGCEPSHCASKDTLSELDFAHVCKCVLGWQQDVVVAQKGPTTHSEGLDVPLFAHIMTFSSS